MADGDEAKAGLAALATSMTDSIVALSATEQAIQKQIQSFVQTSTQTINDLVTNNVYSPELAQETLKIQQAMTERTIAAIQALTPPQATPAPSQDSTDTTTDDDA